LRMVTSVGVETPSQPLPKLPNPIAAPNAMAILPRSAAGGGAFPYTGPLVRASVQSPAILMGMAGECCAGPGERATVRVAVDSGLPFVRYPSFRVPYFLQRYTCMRLRPYANAEDNSK